MASRLFSKLFLAGCLPVATLLLFGCGASNEPQGPEMGELQRYMSEHPELMDTEDEEMDQVDGDEFADVD